MVDVVSDQTTISMAESVTGWSGDSFVLETEILVQGSNSVATIQTANGTNDVIYTGTFNMANSHCRMYMSSNIMPNTNLLAGSPPGIQAILGDGTNTSTWNLGGSDTYSGGWQDFFFDVENPDATSGTLNTAAVTTVTLRINTNTKPRNGTNGWYDNWRFGDGLEINSDTTEAIDFTDVAVEDALVANAYDILQDTDGVLFCKGKLTLGNAAAAKNCNLVSLNETIYFIDRNVAADLYGIVGTEGTGATDIDITGLVCKTVGTSGAELDFSAAVTSFSIDGSTFIDMGAMTFNTGTVINTKFNGCGTTSIATTQTFTGDTWIACGQIDLNSGGKLTNCVVDSSLNASAVLTDDPADLVGTTFKSDGTGHAVNLGTVSSSTAMTWSSFDTGYAATDGSTGNETILINYTNTGTTLVINVAAGYSTPTVYNTGAGTVSVVAGQKTFSFTVSPSITAYEWRLYVDSGVSGQLGTTELAGEESATVDNQSYVYTYSSDTNIVLQIIANGYEEVNYYDILKDADKSVIINLTSEENV